MDLMKEAERLGEEGKVDESMALLQRADEIRKKRSLVTKKKKTGKLTNLE